jgi:hypothetical protein
VSYQRVFSEAWSDVLRNDGIWRTDPWNNLVTIYRFCADLRVTTVTVPIGPLMDKVGAWFQPSESRVDDGRAVYGFATGTFGFDSQYVIVEWPALTRGGKTERYWSHGTVAQASLTWEFTPWTGRQRPQGFRPSPIPEHARFQRVDGW